MIELLVIGGVLALILLFVVGIYNRLVRLRALVREAFSGITVQLRKRADLIPNLVSTVKGYARHEAETLEKVVAQRGAAVSADGVKATAQADGMMSAMLGRLMAVAEAYPELQADDNFRMLQRELSDIEDDLSSARRYYNATARDLNTRVESFPDVLIAGPFGFSQQPYYEDADESILDAPEVSF